MSLSATALLTSCPTGLHAQASVRLLAFYLRYYDNEPWSWKMVLIRIILIPIAFVVIALGIFIFAVIADIVRKSRFRMLAWRFCSHSFGRRFPAGFPEASRWGLNSDKFDKVDTLAGGRRGLCEFVFFDCSIPELHPHSFTMIAIRSDAGSVPPIAATSKYGKQVVDDWTLYREATLKVRQIRAIVRSIPR